MANSEIGFDTDKYIQNQVERIMETVREDSAKLYIEFGGKIIQDRHSVRVLPGYREDAKLEILKEVCKGGEVIFVVSARDILRGRMRGDFKIPYDQETFRTILEFEKRGLKIRHIAISMIDPDQKIPEVIAIFENKLLEMGIKTHRFYAIKNYNSAKINIEELSNNPFIDIDKKIIAIVSPGGGSGKFGICLNQLFHEMKAGVIPNYLKFETFPVHDLPIKHPLNLAFMAASADFYDFVMADHRCNGATSYNRDMENYELLHVLAGKFSNEGVNLSMLSSATNMGINKISTGIINDELVQKEAAAEIARRLIRYKFEVIEGKEDKKVLTQVRNILKML